MASPLHSIYPCARPELQCALTTTLLLPPKMSDSNNIPASPFSTPVLTVSHNNSEKRPSFEHLNLLSSLSNPTVAASSVYIPEVLNTGTLMIKSRFLKLWERHFCVLDRFNLSCYASEQHLLSGHQPDDIIKLRGSSVYDGGTSLTLKSTRIHISTDEGRLHCFSSTDQKQVMEWMVALSSAIEHLTTIDFGPEGPTTRLDRSFSRDDEDPFDDVGIGSRRRRRHPTSSRHQNQNQNQLRRTVSQYIRQGGSTSSPPTSSTAAVPSSSPPSFAAVPQSPRRKMYDVSRWEKWTQSSHACLRYVLDKTHWKRMHTTGNQTLHVGTILRTPGTSSSSHPPALFSAGKVARNGSGGGGGRTVYKATCMVRAAPETVAQVIADTHTRGLWDAQFPIANVIDSGGGNVGVGRAGKGDIRLDGVPVVRVL